MAEKEGEIMGNSLAFSGDHLTDQEKVEQAQRCLDILKDVDSDRFSRWEGDFFPSIQEQASNPAWVPSYRQLNSLKDMVEKYA